MSAHVIDPLSLWLQLGEKPLASMLTRIPFLAKRKHRSFDRDKVASGIK